MADAEALPDVAVKEEKEDKKDSDDWIGEVLRKGQYLLVLFLILMLFSMDSVLKFSLGWLDGTRDEMALTFKGETIKNLMVCLVWAITYAIIEYVF